MHKVKGSATIRKVKALSHGGAYVNMPSAMIGKDVLVIDLVGMPKKIKARLKVDLENNATKEK